MTSEQKDQLQNLKDMRAEIDECIVTKTVVNGHDQYQSSSFVKELGASVKEAGQIKRGEIPPSRRFIVSLCKDQEIAASPGCKRYRLDIPAIRNGDKLEIHIDAEHRDAKDGLCPACHKRPIAYDRDGCCVECSH